MEYAFENGDDTETNDIMDKHKQESNRQHEDKKCSRTGDEIGI